MSISISSYSQNWSLNNVDETKEFGFEYWFSFQNEDDESVLKITEKKNCGETKIIGRISDSSKNDISGANVKIKSKEANFEKNIKTDFDGKFKLIIDDGEYTIEIDYPGFDKLISDFIIDEKSKLNMNVFLGLGPELQVYQINSKEKLNENKISEIIKCVEQKRNKRKFSTMECSDKKEYQVTMHI